MRWQPEVCISTTNFLGRDTAQLFAVYRYDVCNAWLFFPEGTYHKPSVSYNNLVPMSCASPALVASCARFLSCGHFLSKLLERRKRKQRSHSTICLDVISSLFKENCYKIFSNELKIWMYRIAMLALKPVSSHILLSMRDKSNLIRTPNQTSIYISWSHVPFTVKTQRQNQSQNQVET